ncbi:hypothetical protein FIBSPDRAFT_963791 [Athelia psychrophila]|uniref:Uncharacterized protein n=1 Tax=Athelia psychrophila TaxID=1759441 RepID=A0A165YKZ7_9AGAM|nr:hypothetical protein FIBSPDRAFT_963791 [Fibularhizoctonia sp. CBS 109695]
MSVTESDSKVLASLDDCYSIHNQQGGPGLYPPSPEYYVDPLAMERSKDWVEHGYGRVETDMGAVTRHDQGMQTDTGTVTTRDQGT